ncbi:hypothetical protein F4774DRAFT_141190 [Daldinia eschscholtzii]|nr:hypothetical protein F4774DRAFT_141190 [Daldinia eschscholtzii]
MRAAGRPILALLAGRPLIPECSFSSIQQSSDYRYPLKKKCFYIFSLSGFFHGVRAFTGYRRERAWAIRGAYVSIKKFGLRFAFYLANSIYIISINLIGLHLNIYLLFYGIITVDKRYVGSCIAARTYFKEQYLKESRTWKLGAFSGSSSLHALSPFKTPTMDWTVISGS